MTSIRITSIVVLFGGLAAACGQDNTAGDGGLDMSAALAEATQENERHAEACLSASSMPGMMDELGRHEDRMAGAMMRMDDAHERMATGSMGMVRCSGRGFEHMSGGLDGVHSEMSGHSERMRAAATLGAAQSECATHTDAMKGMMQGMIDDLDTMPCMHP